MIPWAAPYCPRTLDAIRSMATVPPSQIAARLGWDEHRLARIARGHGIELTPPKVDLADALIGTVTPLRLRRCDYLEKIVATLKGTLFLGWMTSKEIGRALKMNPSTIMHYLKAYREELKQSGYPIESHSRYGYRIARNAVTASRCPPRPRFELSADMTLNEIAGAMPPSPRRVFGLLVFAGINASPTHGDKICHQLGMTRGALAVQLSLIRRKLRPTRWALDSTKGPHGGYRIIEAGTA